MMVLMGLVLAGLILTGTAGLSGHPWESIAAALVTLAAVRIFAVRVMRRG